MINNVGLIGVGRFGKVLANILKKGFHVKAYDIVPSKISGNLEKCELEEILDVVQAESMLHGRSMILDLE